MCATFFTGLTNLQSGSRITGLIPEVCTRLSTDFVDKREAVAEETADYFRS